MNQPATTKPAHHYVTIAEFCERFGICRAFYYNLRETGEGPDELRMGARKVVITVDSLVAWEKNGPRRPGLKGGYSAISEKCAQAHSVTRISNSTFLSVDKRSAMHHFFGG